MAVKGKREPKPQAGPGALVDLNLWDVLVGLMEPTAAPGHDPGPDGTGPAAAGKGEAEQAEIVEEVRATARKVGRGSRRERRRGSGSGSEE